MADISYVQREDPEDSDEAMEAEDDEEVNDNLGSENSENGVWDGASGDKGGGEQHSRLAKLLELTITDASFNRQMVGSILVDIFRDAVNNKATQLLINDVMQPVQRIVDDPEAQVRSDLVEQLPVVAMICQKMPQVFDTVLHQHLLPIIIKYLKDTDTQVRQAAQVALLTLLKHGLLDNGTIETEVCPVVEHLLSNMPVDFLNSGISLMSKIAPLIGKELTEKVFLDKYITLCEDNICHVRQICATHFGEICAAVGRKALFRRLFPTFVDLCCDKVWGVRKACVDVMIPVSCCLTLQYRRVLLAEILATHLNDDSKWVRMAAFQILGPFISTFAKQFTEVTYNQHGELVFTSQQDNHFSIRYSYESIFPTKCPSRSETYDSASEMDYCVKGYTRMDRVSDASANNKNGDGCWRTELRKLFKAQTNKKKKNFKNDDDDVDKFNPFLYYYIPPDLPLDDELVRAAKKSASENSAKTSKEFSSSESENKTSADSSDTITSESEANNSNENPNANETTDVQKNENPEVTNSLDSTNDKKENEDMTFVSLEDTTNLLNDTIDISNLSTDRSSIGSSLFENRQDEESEEKKHDENKETGGQEIVPQDLIDYFVSMAEPEQCTDIGAEISHHCAFSFPAVALTLGRENWPYLKKAYQSLACAKQWKVRRTLASSIHEIAIILGEELTATDLVPIYDGFIKDLDEVRIGVLKHLATFLKVLTPTHRCQYLPRLYDFLATDNEWNWRFREELATQLLEVLYLFKPGDVAKHIAPLSVHLLGDKIAAVRQVAITLVCRIMSHLSTDKLFKYFLLKALIQEIRDTFAQHFKWIRRQTYALLCAQLITSGAITNDTFSKEMLPSLLKLSRDKVPNVRLVVARTLFENVSTMGSDCIDSKQAEEVDRRLKQMRLDPDRDVRVLAGGNSMNPLLAFIAKESERTKNILF